MELPYFGQDHAHRLQDFIDSLLGFSIVLGDCNHAVSCDCGVDLNANCILRHTPESLDIEVLLHPFEKQFDLLSAFVKVRNFQIIRA